MVAVAALGDLPGCAAKTRDPDPPLSHVRLRVRDFLTQRKAATYRSGLYILHKDSPDIFDRCPHSVDIYVLLRLAVRCPHPNHIALVGNDVYQLVLPEEAGNRRIALVPFLARLDRKCDEPVPTLDFAIAGVIPVAI